MNLPILHVKWFIETDSSSMNPIYLLMKTPFIIWTILVITLVVLAALIENKLRPKVPQFIENLSKHRTKILYIFQFLVGASLIFASYQNSILVPHYPAENLPSFIKIAQTLAGLILIGNFAHIIAAILLIFVYLSATYYFGFFEVIDYINLIGIAAFLILAKSSNQNKANLAAPILRITTGLALFILALSEKLLYPDRAYAFLDKYPMHFLDIKLFTLSAGAMEAAFGLILILGFITRINITILLGFFLASNIFFFLKGYHFEALIELMGHLPVIASVIIFIVYGSGKLFKAKK